MELVKYNYNGVMMTQKEICERTGISPSTMCNRLHAGMSVDEAVIMLYVYETQEDKDDE